MSLIDKIFGDPNEKVIKTLRPVVEQINALEKKYQAMLNKIEGLTCYKTVV